MKRYIKSNTQSHYYIYDGPVYEFGKYLGEYQGRTKAKSFDKAKNILNFKAKQKFDRLKGDKIDLDDSCFDEVYM